MGKNDLLFCQYLNDNQHWLTLYHLQSSFGSPWTHIQTHFSFKLIQLMTSVSRRLIIVRMKDCGEERSPTSSDPSAGEMP